MREPRVSGLFYSSDYASLTNTIASFLQAKIEKKPYLAKGLLLPHAGYPYSGMVAAQTIASFKLADTIVILGTRHTFGGKAFALSPDNWRTPLGEVKRDEEFSRQLIESSNLIEEDSQAHLEEHSIEVQLPLLQYIKETFAVVPIVVSEADIKTYQALARDIAACAAKINKDITVIASSDLTHYEPQDAANKKDKLVIEAVLALDADRLINQVAENNISMCGVAPTCVMLEAAKLQQAREAVLIKYQTSGDVTGDTNQVVGYAGIGIY